MSTKYFVSNAEHLRIIMHLKSLDRDFSSSFFFLTSPTRMQTAVEVLIAHNLRLSLLPPKRKQNEIKDENLLQI